MSDHIPPEAAQAATAPDPTLPGDCTKAGDGTLALDIAFSDAIPAEDDRANQAKVGSLQEEVDEEMQDQEPMRIPLAPEPASILPSSPDSRVSAKENDPNCEQDSDTEWPTLIKGYTTKRRPFIYTREDVESAWAVSVAEDCSEIDHTIPFAYKLSERQRIVLSHIKDNDHVVSVKDSEGNRLIATWNGINAEFDIGERIVWVEPAALKAWNHQQQGKGRGKAYPPNDVIDRITDSVCLGKIVAARAPVSFDFEVKQAFDKREAVRQYCAENGLDNFILGHHADAERAEALIEQGRKIKWESKDSWEPTLKFDPDRFDANTDEDVTFVNPEHLAEAELRLAEIKTARRKGQSDPYFSNRDGPSRVVKGYNDGIHQLPKVTSTPRKKGDIDASEASTTALVGFIGDGHAETQLKGPQTKVWGAEQAIVAANREFNLAGLDLDVESGEVNGNTSTALYTLYTMVIHEIKRHYSQVGQGSRKVLTETNLIRTTKDAAQNAARVYLAGISSPYQRAQFEKKLPPKHKVLASRFVGKHGAYDGSMAGWLATCQRCDLMQISGVPFGAPTYGTVPLDGQTRLDAADANAAFRANNVAEEATQSSDRTFKKMQKDIGNTTKATDGAQKELRKFAQEGIPLPDKSVRPNHLADDTYDELVQKLLANKDFKAALAKTQGPANKTLAPTPAPPKLDFATPKRPTKLSNPGDSKAQAGPRDLTRRRNRPPPPMNLPPRQPIPQADPLAPTTKAKRPRSTSSGNRAAVKTPRFSTYIHALNGEDDDGGEDDEDDEDEEDIGGL